MIKREMPRAKARGIFLRLVNYTIKCNTLGG